MALQIWCDIAQGMLDRQDKDDIKQFAWIASELTRALTSQANSDTVTALLLLIRVNEYRTEQRFRELQQDVEAAEDRAKSAVLELRGMGRDL